MSTESKPDGSNALGDKARTAAAVVSVPAKFRIQRNRRKTYLDRHPAYFSGSDLELADPLLYDRLIRRFQSATERENEGRKKGYSGILEADILRSEAKMDALAHPDPNVSITYKRGVDGEIVAEDLYEAPSSKEEAYEIWRKQMEWRFLKGGDLDFDYSAVDENEEYDDHALEQREEEEHYFDAETPSFEPDVQELKGETGVQDY